MSESFLLTRVLLRFQHPSEDLHGELSAVAISDDGSLWVGSDEYLTLERLSPIEPGVYGEHEAHAIADFIELPNTKDEIDIEGMDFTDSYLWFVGSHSTKRKKPKGKTIEKDLKRLTKIKSEANRYLLARIPVVGGMPLKSCSHPDNPDLCLSAAALQTNPEGNILMDALRDDPHLGPFVKVNLPSKDNGLDIEGLAVRGQKVFLGLRGPVLRGWAVLLEIEVTETAPGLLGLKAIGKDGQLYKKHLLDLDGLGVRELCWLGDDLIVLGGSTMELAGATRLFCLKNPLELEEDSICDRDSDRLVRWFDLPFTPDGDKAEGLALFPCLGQSQALLVVYDSPREARKPEPKGVFADVFLVGNESSE
ncbi:MAG: DUF3616 domain-containing protein [Cyanobacteriota bacterium]|nr:DUF3616 domain-containing protein [Cyanobacteriota bacterium]